MALAIVLALLVLGSILFHFLSPWWFTPIASNWRMIDDTVSITFWVAGLVFAAVNLFMAYCIIRYRYRAGNRAHYEPENKKLEWWLIGLTTIGIVAMLAPGLLVWAQFVNPPADALVIEVVGQQWRWSYRFPGRDGALGAVDTRHISATNPFGISSDDPAGQDDLVIDNPVLHLPLGKPVKVLLRSKDVIHDFDVPQFRVKMDMVPGQVTYFWLTPTRIGTFDVLCQELCGIAHFAMRGLVVVEPVAAFQTWLDRQPTFAQSQQMIAGDAAAGQIKYTVCSACHGAQGQGDIAQHAPKLSGQTGAYLQRQLQYFKTEMRGVHALDIYGQQMAPMAATLTDSAAINDVVAYIGTLPDTPAAATLMGDAEHGKALYTTCAVCHGLRGQGNPGQGAPRLAGMSDWYMGTQLNNFKGGVRGVHPADSYGSQMRFMAATLNDEQAIDDLLAYVNTL
ncbi:MAG TPA: c-type cytochrome [Spongiibacteraceae bacterium]|nr:c-type cytochrome [Spongiibacteraceae bacterium]